MTPSCRGVEFSFAAFNINRRYLCVTALKYCAEMSWSFTAVSLAGVRKSDAARGKSRWDASVSTLTELELKSLNRHHRGLFQCLLETRQGWWYGLIPKQAFHELYQNIAWLFGLTQTKPLLCVHVCVCVWKTLRESWLSDFLIGGTQGAPSAWRRLVGDGILQPLDSLAQEYYYWFWSWATAYWMHRLVFSTANSSSGSYRSVLMTSFCKDAFSLLNGRCKYIYLSLSQASSRGERRLPVEIMPDD